MSQEWKLVPVTATEEMIHAIALGVHRDISTAEIWPEVLAYAPVPPASGELLVEALRQYRHNTGGDELVVGYEYDATRRLFTRLQAENAALQHRLTITDQRVDDLQSDLTKARELLSEVCGSIANCDHYRKVCTYLSHQSAPAAKGETYAQ